MFMKKKKSPQLDEGMFVHRVLLVYHYIFRCLMANFIVTSSLHNRFAKTEAKQLTAASSYRCDHLKGDEIF